MAEAPRLESFVEGRFRGTAGAEFVPRRNPSDREDVVGLVPAGDPEDVDPAVRSASDALDAWKGRTGPSRAEHLHRWSTEIERRQEPLA
jgi:acyl-CoA reductase-like NAD-dependent aldehyde dehydrogenase